jgi:hypothetical protein
MALPLRGFSGGGGIRGDEQLDQNIFSGPFPCYPGSRRLPAPPRSFTDFIKLAASDHGAKLPRGPWPASW